MHGVSFLSVPETFWGAWSLEVIEIAGGSVALLGIAIVLTRGKVHKYFWFTPKQPLEQLMFSCSKVLACWSLVTLVILIPIYVSGAKYFGETSLQTAL